MADVGEKVAERSGGLLDVSRCSLSNPERDTHRVLVGKFGLAIDVKRSHDIAGCPDIPLIRMRSWFDFFLKNSCMHILTGLKQSHPARETAILSGFWRNFKELHPNHQVFQLEAAGVVSLAQAIPLLLHGDEGRGRRHTAHFVLSMHGMLGLGFEKMSKRSKKWARMEVNFSGHTFTNRFLLVSLRKRDYTDQNSATWAAVMNDVAEEVGNWCDMPLRIAISGHRSWNNWRLAVPAQKCCFYTVIQQHSRSTLRNPPKGICHLCHAGQLQYQFEQLETKRPDWMATLFNQDPFEFQNPLADHLLHEPGKAPAIWCFDWFHTMHLGVLKSFLASVLALMSEQEPDGSVDERFRSLTGKYKTFCSQNSHRVFISKISKEMLGWEKRSAFPNGTWHQGGLTTQLMNFVEFRFKTELFADPLLTMAAEACEAVQACSRYLYRSSLWLEPAQCKLVAELGFKFLRRYSQLASLAKSQDKCMFVLQPKVHCLHHFLLDLWSAFQRNVRGLNPLGMSCQPSEDFIGRPSRMSRRVTAQKPVLERILDRYCQSVYAHFVRQKYLVRPLG